MAEFGVCQCEEERTCQVANRIANMTEQGFVKINEPAITIFVACCLHFGKNEWVASDGSLAKNNQAPRQDICTFHGYCNRCRHVRTANVIIRPEAEGFAAMHVHRVGTDFSAELSAVILEYRRRHRRLFTLINRTSGNRHRSVHDVGAAGDTC